MGVATSGEESRHRTTTGEALKRKQKLQLRCISLSVLRHAVNLPLSSRHKGIRERERERKRERLKGTQASRVKVESFGGRSTTYHVGHLISRGCASRGGDSPAAVEEDASEVNSSSCENQRRRFLGCRS